jgi:hypothetical protein
MQPLIPDLSAKPQISEPVNYEKIIFENEDKGFQYRLTLSEFRGIEYVGLRKYYLDYEGDYLPSNEGATIPATMQNIFALLDGLIELCAGEEVLDSIESYFTDKISILKSKAE